MKLKNHNLELRLGVWPFKAEWQLPPRDAVRGPPSQGKPAAPQAHSAKTREDQGECPRSSGRVGAVPE